MPKYKALKTFVGRLPGSAVKYVVTEGDVLDLPARNEWQYIGFVEPIKEKKRGSSSNN